MGLRICQVTEQFHPDYGGGQEQVLGVRKHLADKGHELTVLTGTSKSSRHGRFSFDNFTLERVRSTEIPLRYSGDSRVIYVGIGLNNRVRDVLNRGFDAIHIHEPLYTTLPLTVLGVVKNENVIGTFHTNCKNPFPFSGTIGPVLGKSGFMKRLGKNIGTRIAVSQPAARLARTFFGGNYNIIPNGIDTDYLSPKVPRIASLGDKINILFIGRLVRKKGAREVLDAFSKISGSVKNVRLIVIGDGPELGSIEAKINASGLKNILLTRNVSQEMKSRYYSTSDIVCLPSHNNESSGIALMEAMAAGKPLVTTDIEGYRDTFEPGSGFIVKPQDSSAIADKLLTLVQDGKLRKRMGRAGRKAAERRFSWRVVAKKILKSY